MILWLGAYFLRIKYWMSSFSVIKRPRCYRSRKPVCAVHDKQRSAVWALFAGSVCWCRAVCWQMHSEVNLLCLQNQSQHEVTGHSLRLVKILFLISSRLLIPRDLLLLTIFPQSLHSAAWTSHSPPLKKPDSRGSSNCWASPYLTWLVPGLSWHLFTAASVGSAGASLQAFLSSRLVMKQMWPHLLLPLSPNLQSWIKVKFETALSLLKDFSIFLLRLWQPHSCEPSYPGGFKNPLALFHL